MATKQQVKQAARTLHAGIATVCGSMTLAYRKGVMNEGYPLSRRPDFVPQATFPLFWDGGVP
jgi:hypothetical protein